MDEPDDKDNIVRPLDDLEPEARQLLLKIGMGFWATVLTVYIVFEFLHDPWGGIIMLLSIAGIAVVAVILHRLQTVQFSLATVLIAILTLQIPVALLIMAKSQLMRGLGIVLALLWGAGVVTYVLVTAKPANK